MPAGFSSAGDRRYQEDAWHVARRGDAAVAVVCDGMGAGGSSGHPAADLVTAYVAKSFGRGDGAAGLMEAIEDANRAIRSLADAAQARVPGVDTRWHGMGTTADGVLFTPGRAVVAHVGDGRVYRRAHGGRLQAITIEHTLQNEVRFRQAMLPPGELEALLVEIPGNVIVRALGMAMDLVIDRHEVATAPGDVFVVCSDGVFHHLDDAAMDSILDETPSEGDAARAIVLGALARSLPPGDHHDNATAVVHVVGHDGV